MTKKTSNRFSPEVRERAVRMVLEHGGDHASQWAAMSSIASKIGCTGETLRKWVRQAERDRGKRPGLTSDERGRMKGLARISHAEEARLIGGRGEELASWRCSGLEGKRHSLDEGVWRNEPRSC